MTTLPYFHLALALVLGTAYPLLMDWIEVPLVTRAGTVRDPTEDEIDRLREYFRDDNSTDRVTIRIFEGDERSFLDDLVSVIGLRWRPTMIVGSRFLERGDEVVEPILALQEIRFDKRLYFTDFVVSTVRFNLLLVLLVYLLPPLAPGPHSTGSVVLLLVTFGLLYVLDRYIRSKYHGCDEELANRYDEERVAETLKLVANETGERRSKSRLEEFFDHAPSKASRIATIRSD